MDDVGLKVVLSSEVRGAVNGVNNVNVALNEMGKTAAAAADKTSEALNGVSSTAVKSAKGFGVYSRSLADVSAQQKVLATQARAGTLSYLTQSGAAVSAGKAIDNSITPALKQLSKTGVNSNGVLIDMSRVAQDLPFGFIAIQNNIAPLIESFGRMSREAGGAGAAFKALGGALLGPAGIGFAISTVTSLITFAVQKYGSLGAALSALNPFTASVVGWQRDLNDAITKSAEAAGDPLMRIEPFMG